MIDVIFSKVSLVYFLFYFLVLAFHFSYAWWAISRSRFSLQVGGIRSPIHILSLLLLLNGFSLSVFAFSNQKWCLFNLGLHILLAGDEVVRMRAVPARWPFLMNHVLFAGLIAGWSFDLI